MKNLVLFHHVDFAAPTGDHIMPMRKFAMVAEAVSWEPNIELREPVPVSYEDLLRVHNPDYIEAVKTGRPRELAEAQKFPWTESLYPSVLLTNGGVYAAADHALTAGVAGALASGFHHAGPAAGEGFCTFNGLVVALEKLRASEKIRTAAVLDMDLHYGNGTAMLAESRAWMFALSIYGSDYWNNQAWPDVTERKHPMGVHHASHSLPAGCHGLEMLSILKELLPMLLGHGKPDILLYQAGADPLRDDPYSPLELTAYDLRERDRVVFEFAKENEIPVAWVLAGGYSEDTSKVVDVHVNTAKVCRDTFFPIV
jgi:acetoin utilization deacetylase AcuC-like enzyme